MYYLDKEVSYSTAFFDRLGQVPQASIDQSALCASKRSVIRHGLLQRRMTCACRTLSRPVQPRTTPVVEQARGTTYSGMMHSTDWSPTSGRVVPRLPLAGMGKELSGFDQWDAIVGRRSAEEGPVRTEMILARNSFAFDSDAVQMVKRAT
ncbi:unnamed protein product [Ectocarpus fasciculatus]